MKFFLDANVQHILADPLRSVYRGHEFGTAEGEGLKSLLDVDLFPAIAGLGYDAIITKDKEQHRNLIERRSMYDHGLHWIGHRMKPHKGLLGIALESATVIAGLNFVLQDWREDPHLYLLKGVGAELGQRCVVQRTRLDQWGIPAS